MAGIGIIVAMGVEFRLVSALLGEKKEIHLNGFTFVEGCIGNKHVVLLQCGIGKVCAAVGAVEMIKKFQPDCIINTGVAGGIDAITKVMDIVVGQSVVYHDVWCGEGNKYGQVQGLPAEFAADGRLYEAALSLREEGLYGGLICSGDKFITDRSELDVIKRNFPAGLAVDMESAAIAQVCYLYRLAFLSFRIISDTPGIEDHALQYQDFWTLAPEKSFRVLERLIAIV